MRFPTFDEAEELKRTWTDRYVRVRPGRPEYARFEGRVGRVVTVNYGGKAIVDFADGAWYDVPALAEYLDVVPDEEGRPAFDPTRTSAQKLPTRQG